MFYKISTCKSCGSAIAKNEKICPNCGSKNKQPIYKKWWFWAIVAVIVITIATAIVITIVNPVILIPK